MWFNSTQHEEPYQGLTLSEAGGNAGVLRDTKTGGAWLSSARVVRCWVKSRNERNPCPMLPARKGGNSWETAAVRRMKAGMTSSHHALYALGYTRTTMAGDKGKRRSDPEQIPQSRSQFGLEAATRLHEVGIASNRRSADCGEYVPGPCTHRPSHHESQQHPKPAG